MIIIKAVILAGLVKLLLVTEKPILCAGIYALFAVLVMAAFGFPIVQVFARGGGAFLLAAIYFVLLQKFEGKGPFWAVLILGLAIGLV